MDTAAFTKAVDDGLKLSKRIYAGKDQFATSAPSTKMNMERSHPSNLLPTAPMVYAVINDPGMVDNPDIPSYQPHVYGRCDPVALIPLQMKEIECHVECNVDVAVVVITGKWKVHCVMGSRRCDCRLVVPAGEQGSLLGVEVDIARRSYSTRVICREDEKGNIDTIEQSENGGLIKPQLFFVTIPQVDGGCDISIKVSWAQKLLYKDGQFTISVPFQFPDFVSPFAKIFSKKEKISLIVNTGTKKEVVIHRVSHILKEQQRNVGKLSFLFEANVEHWSSEDFEFSYTVHCSEIFGGTLLQSPSVYDYDQREMFYMYIFPGNNMNTKVFRKEVVFVVDTSKSMLGRPIENIKKALSSALLELSLDDLFNIIAFNEEMYLFSSSLESVTNDRIENATQWINNEFRAEGGTNIKQPLEKAMTLFSQTSGSLPHILLVTDGSVEGERDICGAMKTQLTSKGSLSPRISTFGIGSYCNHYFLRMLSSIGKGQYEAAYDAYSIEDQMHKWFRKALSPILANITIDIFDHLEAFEVYPFSIPDLSLGCPLIVSGRYIGKFPDSVKVKGHLADMSNFFIDLKVQNAKEFALDKVVDRHHIDLLTSQTWFSESKQLEEKVIKRSIGSGIPSEYTCMVLLVHESEKQDALKQKTQLNKHKQNKMEDELMISIDGMKLGFGNIQATAENLPSGIFGYVKPTETFYVLDKAVGCCNKLCDCCCCVCFINACSKMNDRLVIVMTQLCTALCCLACLECCSTACCDGSN